MRRGGRLSALFRSATLLGPAALFRWRSGWCSLRCRCCLRGCCLRWRLRRCDRLSALFRSATLLGPPALFRLLRGRRSGCGRGDLLRDRRRCHRLSALFSSAALIGPAALLLLLCGGRRCGCRLRDLLRRLLWRGGLSALLTATLLGPAALLLLLRGRRRWRCLPRDWRRCHRLSALLAPATLIGISALLSAAALIGISALLAVAGRYARRRCGRRRNLCGRDDIDGRCRCVRGGSQLPACRVVERSALSRCQLLLLGGEPASHGRRHGTRDDLAFECALRWPTGLCGGTAYASFSRRYGCHKHGLSADIHVARYPHRCPRHRLRLHKRGGGNGDDGTGDLPVGVHDIGHIRVVVIVVDDGVVDDGVAAVDVLEITATHGIRRSIDFARRKREPRDPADVAAGDGQLEIIAADERD